MSASVLCYTSSTKHSNAVRVARVAAAGRMTDARRALEAKRARLMEEGQMLSPDGAYVEWCFVCRRPTDHTGEHTPEQIAAWRSA